MGERECIPIDQSTFFLKETIEDIVKLRPNPGGATASLKTAERGTSILACLPRLLGAIEGNRIREAAAEESKSNRTLKEAEKLATAESREPPRDILTLKLLHFIQIAASSMANYLLSTTFLKNQR